MDEKEEWQIMTPLNGPSGPRIVDSRIVQRDILGKWSQLEMGRHAFRVFFYLSLPNKPFSPWRNLVEELECRANSSKTGSYESDFPIRGVS